MNKAELLKLLRGIIGEERGVFLCEIFEDSMGKAIQIRYMLELDSARHAANEILSIYKALQKAGMQHYSLDIFQADKTGDNRYFIHARILNIRPFAVGIKKAGNRWRAEIIHFFDESLVEYEKRFTDLEIVGGKVELTEAETAFYNEYPSSRP